MFSLIDAAFNGGALATLQIAVRALAIASFSVALGALVVGWWLIPQHGASRPLIGRLQWLSGIATLLALIFFVALWPLVAAQMAGATTLAESVPVLRVVLTGTSFGGLLRLVWGLLALAGVLLLTLLSPLKRVALKELRGGVVALLGMVALLQPLMGHGATVGAGYLLPMTSHVLAASLWIGAIPALALGCIDKAVDSRQLLARFSWLGIACVVVLGLSGLVQTITLVASWHALWQTVYGQLIVVKAVLLGALLVLALINRCYWTPRAAARQRGMLLTMGIEWLLALGVIVIAVGLAAQPPPGIMGEMTH
ncbi:CopD family protein [Carnimonas bestiolae]|uniref:CopD family protein n=1 Tax=Carnimonas bestiolae TaxID=3402172 RepID=UPI003EDBFE96